MRGLERAAGRPLRRPTSGRKTSISKVLAEQKDQHESGIFDDEAIAKVNSKVSRKCCFRAQVRALCDHTDMEDCYGTAAGNENDDRESHFEDYLLQGLDGLKTSQGCSNIRKRTRAAS